MAKRTIKDDTISILKGIGIILVVIAHSGCPSFFNHWISSFHMPLFFIASGYLFKPDYFMRPGDFFLRRVKSLYWPFVKWSIAFLLLHNFFYDLGIMNDTYGTPQGYCATRFSAMEILGNSVDVVTKMTSYDYFICGAFWFFRVLFVGGVFFCLGNWVLKEKLKISASVQIIMAIFCFAGCFKIIWGKDIPNWPQGGYREMMAVFFIGMGYLSKKYLVRLNKWKIAIGCFLLLCVSAIWFPTHMGYRNQTVQKWAVLCITGYAGFLFIYWISSIISNKTKSLNSFLSFMGDNSLYVIIFHILFFKPASYLKTIIWNLDWKMIGCHPVIYGHNEWFWLVYTAVSLLLCVGIIKTRNVLMTHLMRV